jgi:hypothetical protein
VRERRELALLCQGSFSKCQETSPTAEYEVHIANSLKSSHYTLNRENRVNADRPPFKPNIYKSNNCMSESTVRALMDCSPHNMRTVHGTKTPSTQNTPCSIRFQKLAGGPSAPRGGPSAVHLCSTTRINNVSGQTFQKPGDRPSRRAAPSALQQFSAPNLDRPIRSNLQGTGRINRWPWKKTIRWWTVRSPWADHPPLSFWLPRETSSFYPRL